MHIGSISFDSDDALELASFWAAALDWTVWPDSTAEFAAVGGSNRPPDAPRILISKVPEPKTAKNRCHLDLQTDDLDAEVERLQRLGAIVVDSHELHGTVWRVMQDPSGNEFCVVQA